MEAIDAPTNHTETGHLVWGVMPVELEACELLYALVRYTKPELIVEGGTGSGRSTLSLLQGCIENQKGKIVTFESQDKFFEEAKGKFSSREEVEVRKGFSRHSDLSPDFVFVDTGGGEEIRNREITHWLQHENKPLVVVHDGTRNYSSFSLGVGVNIPGWDGIWIGRGRGKGHS